MKFLMKDVIDDIEYKSSKSSPSVGARADGIFLDTADSLSGFNSDLDVSLISPGGTPRVLDEVVGSVVLNSISDGEDTVIEVSSTSASTEDTSLVDLEGKFVSLDSNGGRSLGDGGLESIRVVSSDGVDFADLNGSLGLGVIFASSVFTSVRVGRLELSKVRLVVLEGEGHGTTLASIASLGAVNELLLREAQEFLGGDLVGTFKSSSGGESPA